MLNYTELGNGGAWPADTRHAFVDEVTNGAGVVVFHAASSAFPDWSEYNEIIGLGGWGGRHERAGTLIRYRGGRLLEDRRPGKAGHHGQQHEFAVEIRPPLSSPGVLLHQLI